VKKKERASINRNRASVSFSSFLLARQPRGGTVAYSIAALGRPERERKSAVDVVNEMVRWCSKQVLEGFN
jgi:hypothetical protein